MSLEFITSESVAMHPAAAGATLIIDGLCRRYEAAPVLDDLSLRVEAGEIVCILGPSGSGKSTLLRLVAGVDRPSAGRVVIAGVEVVGPGVFVEPEQRRVGMVFQDYALFPHLTIEANVAFGLRGRARQEAARTVAALLDQVDLTRYASSYPHMLSGGERQRAALARALAPGPQLLLMDEPFSSLDGRLREQVRDHTLDILRATGTTTIVVTHDPHEAMRIADRIALLRDGRLVQCGSPVELYERPATMAAARMFGDINELGGTCHNGRIDTPLGSFAAPHIAERGVARVCIRPEHLRLASRPTNIPARVIRTSFLGEVDHVVLAVAGLESPLTVRAFGRTKRDADESVYLDVTPEDVFIIPHDQN